MTFPVHCQHDLILWDVVEEHFSEAEFLFEQWEHALRSPTYNLTKLGMIERRLEAHLDGLVVGGRNVAARLLDSELANADEAGRATVAALALIFSGEEEAAGRVIETTLHAEAPLQQALARALMLARVGLLDRMLLARFRVAGPELQKAILLEVLTYRGVDVGDLLHPCSRSSDGRLISAVLDAAGRFGRRELISLAEEHLSSGHPLGASALKTSLVLGSQEAWWRCRQLVQEPRVDDPDALLLVALLGQPADHHILYAQLENPAHIERILWALGFCGTSQAGDSCLACLESKEARVAKAAAEAMAWIGGFDLNDLRFRDSATEPGEDETLPPLKEDDLDADLGVDGLDDLPIPNRPAIALWWKESSGRLEPDQRYLLGRPYSAGTVVHALEAGSLWRRHGVALELGIRSRGEQHVSTDAFSSRQCRQIAMLAGMSVGQWSRMEP
jgi:uncharacterized protein (TIGR02270 family)